MSLWTPSPDSWLAIWRIQPPSIFNFAIYLNIKRKHMYTLEYHWLISTDGIEIVINLVSMRSFVQTPYSSYILATEIPPEIYTYTYIYTDGKI